ncbi:MAG: VWA domain-containing protein [Akkermansiaceae bacterium]|nr:VWA domain-containing protein [Akkermansiaceae bacterium]
MILFLANSTAQAAAETIPADREFLFAQPAWLWALVLLPALLLLRRRHGTATAIRHPGIRFIADQLPTPSAMAGFIGPLTSALAMAFIILALAQPQWKEMRHEPLASGIDIMITCDVSGSMYNEDMLSGNKKITRLAAAKQVINDFINSRPNDRMGLVAFAGKTKLSSPLTMDHDILRYKVQGFESTVHDEYGHIVTPGTVLTPGTAIGSAIAAAAVRLDDRKETKSKIIILVTDGVNSAGEITPIEAARYAADLGIRIYTIAIGNDNRLSDYTYQEDGIDEKTLQEIAEITGGQYYRASSGQSLAEAFAVIDQLEKTDSAPRIFEVRTSLFYWPLSLAGLCLVLALAYNLILPRPAP